MINIYKRYSKTPFSIRIKAFSLYKVLMVLVLIGLFVLLTLPRLIPLISKVRTAIINQQLNHLYTFERTRFCMISKYSNVFNQVGFEQSTLITNDGNVNYSIEIVLTDQSGFLARAPDLYFI